jgi:hypothetical protein
MAGTNEDALEAIVREHARLVYLREGADDLQLEVRCDVSNLDLDSAHDHSVASAPIVRQIQINGSTLFVTGKVIVIGTVDDPNSNREFQLEVIATKLR